MCTDSNAIRTYFRGLRRQYDIAEDRRRVRVYEDIKTKYFVDTNDGYVKLMGELIPSTEIIIEGLQHIHGHENVWLLQICSGESTLIGFATGWNAAG